MSISLQSKLPNVGETIFTTMSLLAQEYGAINLGQGFPDFDMNEELIELVNRAMKDGHNQYAPRNGYLKLREAIAEKVADLYKTTIDPNKEVCITPGATYAIYTALTSVLQKGDEVIVFEPAYDSYIPNIEINGAVPVLIPLNYPDYKIDWDDVKEKITPATKLIILNSPHNPSGSLLDKSDMAQLQKIVEGTSILILSDEVYEHIIFDGKEHESILKYPELLKRSFVVFSLGKVYHCTGWKTGYCIAPNNLMVEFLKAHQYNTFCCFSPVQIAFAEFLQRKEEYLQLGYSLQKKRDYFSDLMSQSKIFKPLPSHGTYFQLYSYDHFSKEAETGIVATPASRTNFFAKSISASLLK
jgi:methionine aminotransferase